MRFRNVLAVSGLIALGATPFAAQAGGSDKAADACIQAFVDTYLPKDRSVQIKTLSPIPGPLGIYTKRYTVDLSAKLSRNGEELVTARCVANAYGRVLDLSNTSVAKAPVNAGVARLK